jgi:aspartyl-tRNA(Asn)/glutamyl-tRNA(Gln) amidotransferase subunit C
MAQTTRDDVAHMARLARLQPTDDELELFAGQLAKVLGHARASGPWMWPSCRATAHPYPLRNVLRPEVICARLVLARLPDPLATAERLPALVDYR